MGCDPSNDHSLTAMGGEVIDEYSVDTRFIMYALC